MQLLDLPGVFTPISDSRLLADAVRREVRPGQRVLDLCTGSGIVALAAAEAGGVVTAVDVSRKALLATHLNAWRNGLDLDTRRGQCFEAVAGARFDVVAGNPPYVPSEADEVPTRGLQRAWAAGRSGRIVLDQICDDVIDHLRPGGVALLVHSDLIDEGATLDRLRRAGMVDAQVVERHRGPLGPLMREQQEAGTIPADRTHEDVVVIRAVAPG